MKRFFAILFISLSFCFSVKSQEIPHISKDSIKLFRETAQYFIDNDECEKGMKLYQILALNHDAKSAMALSDIYNSGRCAYIDKYEADKWKRLNNYLAQTTQTNQFGVELANKFGIDISKINGAYSDYSSQQTENKKFTNEEQKANSDSLKSIYTSLRLLSDELENSGNFIAKGAKLQNAGIAIGICTAAAGGIAIGVGAARAKYNTNAMKVGGITGGVIAGIGALISLILEIEGISEIEIGGVLLRNAGQGIAIRF